MRAIVFYESVTYKWLLGLFFRARHENNFLELDLSGYENLSSIALEKSLTKYLLNSLSPKPNRVRIYYIYKFI